MSRLLTRFIEDVSTDNPTRRFYLSLAAGGLPMSIGLYLNFRADDLLSYIYGAVFILELIGALVFRKRLIVQHKRIQEKR